MTGQQTPRGETSSFASRSPVRLTMWPHRSLSRRGQAIVLCLLGAGFAIYLLRLPAAAILPVLAPMLIVLAGTAWAFRVNRREQRFKEIVDIGARSVRVSRVSVERDKIVERAPSQRFDSYWLRVKCSDDREREARLILTERGRSCEIAAFLSPDERRELAAEIRSRLSKETGRTA